MVRNYTQLLSTDRITEIFYTYITKLINLPLRLLFNKPSTLYNHIATLWLTQKRIIELFVVQRSAITKHLKKYEQGRIEKK